MYSASWCGVCTRARAFMQAAQISFTERDVDTDATAAQEARRLNPRGSVPTFDVGGIPVIGFDPRSLASAMESAAARQ